MKKKVFIICGIVILIVISISIFIILNKLNSSKKTNIIDKTPQQEVEDINTMIVNGMSKENYKKLTGKDTISETILVGDDSYLRETLDTKYKKIEDITAYENVAKILAKNVETKIQSNFSSQITETVVSEEGVVVVRINYKPYYYYLYLHDLNNLQVEIMKLAGYSFDLDNLDITDKRIIDFYKAKVIAMKIMDNYLNNYENNDEYFKTEILYPNGDTTKTNAYVESYLLCVDGSLSSKNPLSSDKTQTERLNLVKTYLNEAIEKGIIDKNNPLKI